ncbi:hypothetical protein VNI00_000239 [Paramarasmius palmivorus]|uniref:Uncharacterized protein n=1 Tax=Paramarasmius palmivorus TaxID=297713 RepID=A0AAW0ECQ9_9AGAR
MDTSPYTSDICSTLCDDFDALKVMKERENDTVASTSLQAPTSTPSPAENQDYYGTTDIALYEDASADLSQGCTPSVIETQPSPLRTPFLGSSASPRPILRATTKVSLSRSSRGCRSPFAPARWEWHESASHNPAKRGFLRFQHDSLLVIPEDLSMTSSLEAAHSLAPSSASPTLPESTSTNPTTPELTPSPTVHDVLVVPPHPRQVYASHVLKCIDRKPKSRDRPGLLRNLPHFNVPTSPPFSWSPVAPPSPLSPTCILTPLKSPFLIQCRDESKLREDRGYFTQCST